MKTSETIGQRADLTARLMAVASAARKNAALSSFADLLAQKAADEESLRQVTAMLMDELSRLADEKDPIGTVVYSESSENGRVIEGVRAPIGAVGVVADGDVCCLVRTVALLIKTGNAGVFFCDLKTAENTRTVIAMWRQSLHLAGLPADAVQVADACEAEAFFSLPAFKKILIKSGSPPYGGRPCTKPRAVNRDRYTA